MGLAKQQRKLAVLAHKAQECLSREEALEILRKAAKAERKLQRAMAYLAA